MKQYTNFLLVGAVMLCVSSAGLAAQPPVPSAPVSVVNTDANPVPVVGDVEITNTTPIPVTVVPPGATSQVMCSFRGNGASSGTGQVLQNQSSGLNLGLQCPTGVSGVNARRVILSPYFSSFPTQNALAYTLVVGIGAALNSQIENTEILGAFSYGDLEKTL